MHCGPRELVADQDNRRPDVEVDAKTPDVDMPDVKLEAPKRGLEGRGRAWMWT